jgi:hypothetical protein
MFWFGPLRSLPLSARLCLCRIGGLGARGMYAALLAWPLNARALHSPPRSPLLSLSLSGLSVSANLLGCRGCQKHKVHKKVITHSALGKVRLDSTSVYVSREGAAPFNTDGGARATARAGSRWCLPITGRAGSRWRGRSSPRATSSRRPSRRCA